MFKFSKIPKLKLSWFLIGLFALSRLVILCFPPRAFSEIIYSYMPYAHLWASGVKPYLEQWYEYPPATIPLFYAPHLVDISSLGFWWHLDYREAYKVILLACDMAVFSFIWRTLKKFEVKRKVFVGGILFYILATLKAHDFIYDTMDLVFALAVVLGVSAPVLWEKTWQGFRLGNFAGWIGFFLATALKYINAPLGILYALLEVQKKHFVKNLLKLGLVGAVAGGVVWGLPVVIFRSSLQVSFLYHQLRGLQIDSAGATLARLINVFTHSEKVIELYKNYEVTGPVSAQILRAVEIIFPLSILLYLGWGMFKIWLIKFGRSKILPTFDIKKVATNKARQTNEVWQINVLRIYLTLGYVFLFMLTGKVLSRPFLLWHLPLLALFPFKNATTQWRFFIPSLMIVAVTMTDIRNVPVGILDTHLIVALIRTGLFLYLLVSWLRLKEYGAKF